jgi:hypothetical protein
VLAVDDAQVLQVLEQPGLGEGKVVHLVALRNRTVITGLPLQAPGGGDLADREKAEAEEEGENVVDVGLLLLQGPQVEEQQGPDLRAQILQQERKALVCDANRLVLPE